jgi:hypothetical protein
MCKKEEESEDMEGNGGNVTTLLSVKGQWHDVLSDATGA